MKNTIENQLSDLGFEFDGVDYKLDIRTVSPSREDSTYLVASFECDDDGEWMGDIYSYSILDHFSEKWDGEQPISKWLERMEAKYWDV